MSGPLDLPRVCDAVFATCVPGEDGQAAALFWARTRYFQSPLLLLDWDVRQLAPVLWSWVGGELDRYSLMCRARYGQVGVYVEDEALAVQVSGLGVRCAVIYDHLVGEDRWTSLCHTATMALKGGMVKIARPAHERTEVRAAGFLSFSGGPRGDDPTVPAFVYGVVLALDSTASVPPRPARVKIAA